MCRRNFGLAAMLAIVALAVPSAGNAADDVIARVKQAGELRACFADDNPWAFKNPGSGAWEGVLPDMAAGLAATMEVKLVQVDSNWASLVQALQADQCDLIAAPLFATVKRAEQVIFTAPYAYEYTTVRVPVDSPYHTYEEIDKKGNTIAVRAGTAPADFAAKFFKNATLKTYLGDSALTVLSDLAAKRIDGWIDSVISTDRFLAQNPQYPVRAIGDRPLEAVQLVWAVKSGEYQWQQLLNTYITTYRLSTAMSDSWLKWFGTKYEPAKF